MSPHVAGLLLVAALLVAVVIVPAVALNWHRGAGMSNFLPRGGNGGGE